MVVWPRHLYINEFLTGPRPKTVLEGTLGFCRPAAPGGTHDFVKWPGRAAPVVTSYNEEGL